MHKLFLVNFKLSLAPRNQKMKLLSENLYTAAASAFFPDGLVHCASCRHTGSKEPRRHFFFSTQLTVIYGVLSTEKGNIRREKNPFFLS